MKIWKDFDMNKEGQDQAAIIDWVRDATFRIRPSDHKIRVIIEYSKMEENGPSGRVCDSRV